MSATAPPPTPTVIAQRYELQRMLAQGGMAEVWLAVDLTLDRKVAVKWLKASLASDPVVAERFRREAIAAASLNHPNIVAVHDVFEQDGRQAVVMQLVEGKSLRQVLDTQKRLSPELTCHIGTCVASALDHAHTAGFVHRDVKPGNIMMTSDGRVLLTDFGIAKGLQSADADLTSDNIMMGTAKYLSPEQVRGKKLDGRADLYSLGLVLYECLAGRVPFLGETDADTALARLQRDPTDLTRLRATLPTKLVVSIHQLLSRNPAQRPATGADLVITLRDAAKDGPPPIDPTPYEQSPVSPFGSRRLRRAPSDIAGRAGDRARATRPGDLDERPAERFTPSAPRSAHHTPPAPFGPIPGEVAHVRAAPTPAAGITRDHTPATRAPRGKPAKGLTQEWRPAFTVVVLLLAVSLFVGVLLWTSMNFGGGDPVPPTTVLPDTQPDDPVSAEPVLLGPASIATITAFDPDGDGTESDGDAVLALADGTASTSWPTSCYSSQYMGGKQGVGLVVSFDSLAQQAITVDVQSGPYQVDFFASDADAIPDSIEAWGPPLGTTKFANDPNTVVSPIPPVPSQHILILLKELGRDGTCSDANPYRGRLGEIAIAG
jgi:serine/threonine protein kinase